MRKLVATALMLAFSSLASAAPDRAASAEEAATALAQWQSAFNACDTEQLTALYAPQALFWATTATAPITSTEGVRAYYKAFCAGPVKLQMQAEASAIRTFGGTATAIGSATASYTVQDQPKSFKLRFTLTVQNLDGVTRIVEHHSSMLPAAPAKPAAN